MNDHNLDDLIIDTIAPKNNKTKGLLTIFALLIVVLIVAIILTKTLLKSPGNPELTFEENLSTIIAPELKLQEPEEVAKPKNEPSLSTIIEEKITNSATASSKKILDYEPSIDWRVGESLQKKKLTKEKTPNLEKEENFKAVPKATPIKTKESAKLIVSTPIIKNSPKIKQTIQKTQKTTTSKKYYVQVGSFKEDPSKRFISIIKSSKFSYHITSPDQSGYKKLLIGPYKTRADVDKAKDIVRDRINKSAFVVQK